jgi:anti-sigma B factor antagonist
MEIIEEKKDHVHIFSLSGRLDSNTSPELEENIIQTLENGTNNIILNFENLEYISSAGLRVILKTTKDLKAKKGKLLLCSMQDYVREVFEIAGFDTFLPIAASLDDALKQI